MSVNDAASAITISGAREHNLKNVTVRIPKNALVVLTGVSGSGKSSLAFDTLYAEGQRRYVESLSSYARQFLGQMEKPKYDTIRGLSPTIAIEQKASSQNPRSTVGTVTEIHDYLRVLFARVGKQHCPSCGRLATAQSTSQIVRAVIALGEGTRVSILGPVFRQRKGEHEGALAKLKEKGFLRARIDGTVVRLDEAFPKLDKKSKHDVDVVVDRLVISPDVKSRLTDAIESALKEAGGTVLVMVEGSTEERFFSEKNACVACGLSFNELSPLAFSFNSPIGFCPDCNGLGSRPEMDPELVVPNPDVSIRAGAITLWAAAMARGEGWIAGTIEWISKAFGVDLDLPWKKLPKKMRDIVLYGAHRRNEDWEGLVNQLMRRMKQTQSEQMRQYYLQFFSEKPCGACGGARLKAESRAVKIGTVSIDALSRKTIHDAQAFVHALPVKGADAEVAVEIRKEVSSRLGFLENVGLGYLTLDRAAATLSGGESQRIRLASQIGSELTGVVYVLDEPSIGLHPRDNDKLIATLKALRDVGNSVVVVEHDEDTVRAADHVIDFGVGAGALGGEVVFSGSATGLARDARSLTGAYLSGRRRIEIPRSRRKGTGADIVIRGARDHNLRGVDARFPLGTFIAVTGVSGAGKSTLVNRILTPALARALHGSRDEVGAHDSIEGIEHIDKIVCIDQRPIGRTPRSNPATYTKIFDAVRDLYASTKEARAFGYGPGRFSFNVAGGRCEACGGDGVRKVEMHFLPDVYVTCEACAGKRFNDATLRVTFKGLTIADALALPVRDAMKVFSVHKEIARGLRTLDDVGLGYVQLGQPSPTLSGGEAQRIKLARELARVATGRTLYVLDEPTTGLHFADIEKLLAVLQRLVDAGNTVVVIEHNLDVVKCADWLMDLGPEGGDAGGEIVCAGTPEQVAKVRGSYTGQALQRMLDVRPMPRTRKAPTAP